jgi:hypothetical protein
MENETPKEVSSIDWENRTLCSDGNCIGVIGPDGRCKECGKPYEGDDLPETGEQEIEPADEPVEDSDIDIPVDTQETSQDSDVDEQWEKRTLCSDGNCIGIIGPDGRCKECGKPYEQ